MNKREVLTEATKYISTDLLYGTINGIVVKTYLDNKYDLIIRDNWTPDVAAFRIREAMHDKTTGEPLYVAASERVVNPLGSISVITEDDKKRYLEEFIRTLPYKGDIKTGPDTSINIESQIRDLLPLMQDDYTIFNSELNTTRTLKDYYRVLLSNEYVPLTRVDKEELIMFVKRELMEVYDKFDEDVFADIAVKALDKMDDKLQIEGQEAADYINEVYKQTLINQYNSVNSKPTSVELINLQYNENKKLEATNEYIFMNDEEVNSLSNSLSNNKDLSDRDLLHKTMLEILNGINTAKSINTLSTYDERITIVRNQIQSSFTDDKLLTTLYSTIVSSYAKREDELDVLESNIDDVEAILRDELQGIKNTAQNIKDSYQHTYEDVEYRLESIKYDFMKFKAKVESMGLSMHHELDEVYNLIRSIDVKTQYSKDNISHTSIRHNAELEDLYEQVYSAFRSLNYATTPVERATIEVKVQNLSQELTRKLEDYVKDGSITYEEYESYLDKLNTNIFDHDDNIQRRY